jgi:hypothetical protein
VAAGHANKNKTKTTGPHPTNNKPSGAPPRLARVASMWICCLLRCSRAPYVRAPQSEARCQHKRPVPHKTGISHQSKLCGPAKIPARKTNLRSGSTTPQHRIMILKNSTMSRVGSCRFVAGYMGLSCGPCLFVSVFVRVPRFACQACRPLPPKAGKADMHDTRTA